jgi:hypothetical protein
VDCPKEEPSVRFERILISVLALATVAKPAWATSTTVYCTASCGANDQTAFNNATAGVFFQGITFTVANMTASTTYSDPNGVTLTDYNNNNTLSVTGGNLVDTGSWGFAAALPSVVYDFWFVITAPAFSTLNAGFTAPDGAYSNSFTIGSSGIFFFGVTSTAPITNLVFHNGATQTDALTGFDFASQTQTPEAATLLLIGTGLILLRFFKKRDKVRAKRQPKSPEAQPARFVSPQILAS